MRIISDFHDYYDSVQSLGHDHSLIYNRKTTTQQVKQFPSNVFFYTGGMRGSPMWLNWRIRIIGFCGKTYGAINIENNCPARKDNRFCYKTEDVDKFVKDNYSYREVEEYYARDKVKIKYWHSYRRRYKVVNFFKECETQNFGHLFEKSPIFMVKYVNHHDCPMEITYNPCLKDWEFFKIFDSFRAYQELEMFMGNIARPDKPIPTISDEDMVAIKGFDKWSFRKSPKNQ